MPNLPIFLSVGSVANDEQDAFVRAVEDRLRSEGLEPRTIGRNTFSSDAPLKAVMKLLSESAGTVVIALERSYFPDGLEKRGGPSEQEVTDVKLPTPWNQIEAAIAYSRSLPLLVIVEDKLKSEGLLEAGYDWYVQRVRPTVAALSTNEFNGILADFKAKVAERAAAPAVPEASKPALTEMSVGDLIKNLKPAQLWGAIVGICTLIGTVFTLGAKFGPH